MEKYSVEEFEVYLETPGQRRKMKWTSLHLYWCQQWNQTEHNNDESALKIPKTPKKINTYDNNLETHGDLYLQLGKRIDHLTDSAEGKAMSNLHSWSEMENQKDVMHCTTCNITCVCCVTNYFIMMLIFAKMDYSIKIINTCLKIHKTTNFLTFV